MQLNITVEPGQWTGAFEDIFKSLSQEKREEIFREVVTKWVTFKSAEEERPQLIRDFWRRHGHDSEADARTRMGDVYEFRRLKEQAHLQKTTFEKFAEELLGGVRKDFSETLQTFVRKDPQIKALKEKMLLQMQQDFPKIVQSAVTTYFLNQMQTTMSAAEYVSSNLQHGGLEHTFKEILNNGGQL